MNKWPSHKIIKSNWPDGVNYSMYKAKIIRKIIFSQFRGWVINQNKDLLRNFIRDHFLVFKPSTMVFDCEKFDYENAITPDKIRVSFGYTKFYPRLNHGIRNSKIKK